MKKKNIVSMCINMFQAKNIRTPIEKGLQNFILCGRKVHWDMTAYLKGTGKLEQQKQLLWWFHVYFYLTDKLPKQEYLHDDG